MEHGILESKSSVGKMLIFGAIILFSSFIFSLIGFLLLGILFGASGVQVALGESLTNLNALKLMQILQTTGIFIVPAILSASLFSKKPWHYLGFQRVKTDTIFKTLLIVLISLPAINLLASVNQLIPLSDWMIELEKKAEALTKAFLITDSFWVFLVNIFMVAILPAIGEELIFRGILQRRLVELTRSRWTGIIIAAAVFSGIHMQFQGFIPRFALGVAFGYLLEVTGSIWVPIFAHFFNNAIAATGYMLIGTGTVDERIEDIGGLSDLWLLGIISLIATILLVVKLKREIERNRQLEQPRDSAIEQR
ncbi:lysostaphin resistance A-like protein [Tenuifilum sp.]|jgi:membrane protease YdiL (CAAX protease family)|uniref:lysostaphin resistance A-like protein n=2 Tax=Tenuifilum sp. TaxID=2760880 RepID=UPI002BF75FFC|nr:CPBP family intramembrane metalloprotease [Tenuifilum sp.]HOK86964.1 CPBP family intramembrane metalloprotease [Tenuifilum sp.]HPP90822.1 CPBP family intramembrane metalloprotease [Tenuifilum sp.]